MTADVSVLHPLGSCPHCGTELEQHNAAIFMRQAHRVPPAHGRARMWFDSYEFCRACWRVMICGCDTCAAFRALQELCQ
jgi:hypothetical protein